MVDTRGVRGGIAARADAVAADLSKRAAPPVLVAHDAGAMVALAVAAKVPVRALVLAAPLVPGAAGTHAVTWSRGLVWALLRRRPLGPPHGRAGEVYLEGLQATRGPQSRGRSRLSELARRSRRPRRASSTSSCAAAQAVTSEKASVDSPATAAPTSPDPARDAWLLISSRHGRCAPRAPLARPAFGGTTSSLRRMADPTRRRRRTLIAIRTSLQERVQPTRPYWSRPRPIALVLAPTTGRVQGAQPMLA